MARTAVVVFMIQYLFVVVIVTSGYTTTQFYSNLQTQTQSEESNESAETNSEITGNTKNKQPNTSQNSTIYSITANVSAHPTLSSIDETSVYGQVSSPSWVPTTSSNGLLMQVGSCLLEPGKCMSCNNHNTTELVFTTCDANTGKCEAISESSDKQDIPTDRESSYSALHIPLLFNRLSESYEINQNDEKPSIFYINSIYYMFVNAIKSGKMALQLWTTDDLDSNWTHPMPAGSSQSGDDSSVFGADITGPACLLPQDSGKMHHLFYGGNGTILLTKSKTLSKWSCDHQTHFLSKRNDVNGTRYFDNGGVETGPLPVQLKDGNYLFLYNGYSKGHDHDENNAYNDNGDRKHYSIGWVILDKHDPSKILARSQDPLISATYDWQIGDAPYTCTDRRSVYAKSIVPIVLQKNNSNNNGTSSDSELFRIYFTAAGTSIGSAVISVNVLEGPETPPEFDDYLKLAVFVSAACAAFVCTIVAFIWCKKKDSSVYDAMTTEPEFVSIATGHASSVNGGSTGGNTAHYSHSRLSTPRASRTSDLRVNSKGSSSAITPREHNNCAIIDIPNIQTSLLSSNSTSSSSQTSSGSSFCEECQHNNHRKNGMHCDEHDSPSCSNCMNELNQSLQTSESVRLSQISFRLNDTLSTLSPSATDGNKQFTYDLDAMAKEYGEVLLLS